MPGDWYNSDNYDRALKRSITAEEYDQIIATAEYYVKLYTDGSVVKDINSYLKVSLMLYITYIHIIVIPWQGKY